MAARSLRWRDAPPILILFALSGPFLGMVATAHGMPVERALVGAVGGALGGPPFDAIGSVYSDGEPWPTAIRRLPRSFAFGAVLGVSYALVFGHR